MRRRFDKVNSTTCFNSAVFSAILKNVLTQQACSDLMRGSDDAKA
jgi:hypothetical protein